MTDFETALKALTAGDVRFIVVGAYAAVAHGSSQVTRDLDICYERTPENMQRLALALAPYHPRLRGADPGLPFVLDKRTLAQGMNFTLQTDLGDIDLMGQLSGVGSFDSLLPDAQLIRLWMRLSDQREQQAAPRTLMPFPNWKRSRNCLGHLKNARTAVPERML